MSAARLPTLFDPASRPLSVGPCANERTFAEFFAGIGLARMGLERAGWSIRFANDLDPSKLQMYENHFGDSPHYSTEDVHSLAQRPENIPQVTLAHASFPCTDLSLAGARRGLNEGQSSAFWGFYQLVRGMNHRRPPLILLENVTGFLTSNQGEDFHSALSSLSKLGYTIDAFIVDAAHFVPQSRPRLFVVCKQGVEALPRLSVDQLTPNELRPAALLKAVRTTDKSVNWSFSELPALPEYGIARLDDILDDVPPYSPQWWDKKRAEYLLNQMSDRHRAAADEMIRKRSRSYGTVFRRVRNGRSMAELRTDGIAGCLRTPKGGSGRQILFQAGYGTYRARLLNPNECARLMGARGYRVTAPLNQALFGFGDAVCVDVIEWIAKHYLNPLADQLRSTREPTRRKKALSA